MTANCRRSQIPALAIVLLAVSLGACGGAGKRAGSRTSVAAANTLVPGGKDRDNDGDHNDDDDGVLEYGHPAGPTDRRTATSVVTRYFAAAAAGDGARACGLLVPVIAEAVPENEGRSRDLESGTCAGVMSKLFKLNHASLAQKHDALKVAAVRVEGARALAILEFPTIPETRQITERRVGSTWRLVDLLDSILE